MNFTKQISQNKLRCTAFNPLYSDKEFTFANSGISGSCVSDLLNRCLINADGDLF